MNWSDWLGVIAIVLCVLTFFGCRGTLKRCLRVEKRIYREAQRLNEGMKKR